MQEPNIIEKPETTYVGLRAKFISILSPDANTTEIIPPLWGAFCSRDDEIQNQKGQEKYGVVHWEPKEQRSHPEELIYMCAVAVLSLIHI